MLLLTLDVNNHVCHVFEAKSSTKKGDSDKHACPSFEKHLRLILGILQEQDVFTVKVSRNYKTYKNLQDLFIKLKYNDLLKWIKHTTNSLMD